MLSLGTLSYASIRRASEPASGQRDGSRRLSAGIASKGEQGIGVSSDQTVPGGVAPGDGVSARAEAFQEGGPRCSCLRQSILHRLRHRGNPAGSHGGGAYTVAKEKLGVTAGVRGGQGP